jgi:hypothetical protein
MKASATDSGVLTRGGLGPAYSLLRSRPTKAHARIVGTISSRTATNPWKLSLDRSTGFENLDRLDRLGFDAGPVLIVLELLFVPLERLAVALGGDLQLVRSAGEQAGRADDLALDKNVQLALRVPAIDAAE